MRTKLIALVVVASVPALACGDGGPGSARQVTASAVPDDNFVPDSSVVPNDTEVPTNGGIPAGGPAPPTPPGLGSVRANCARLCAHELRDTCEIDLPEGNCALTCESESSGTCGPELTSAFLCIMDAGACPETFEESDPAVQRCNTVLQRAVLCLSSNEDDDFPG